LLGLRARATVTAIPEPRIRRRLFLAFVHSRKAAGSSGQVIRRHFCPNCGSSIFGEPYRPGMINVMAGTLDDPSVFVPTAEVFCDYAFSWLYDGGERPHLPRGFS
jgi:hypothetical protein